MSPQAFDPFGGGNPFDILSGRPAARAGRPLPQIRGKWFGGVLYVRAEDTADALESQAPAVNRRLIDKLRAAAGKDAGRGDVALLLAVLGLVVLVVGGVYLALEAALHDLPRQVVCTGQAEQPQACGVRP